MKKAIFIVISFFILLGSFPTTSASERGKTTQGESFQVIPDEAIRLRILANSDDNVDQTIKRTIRDEVNAYISKWVTDIEDIKEARQVIQKRLPELKEIVGTTLEEAGVDQSYQVEYGKNVSFPTKLYGPYIYPAGEYEAILITLGDGKGANWWCVLFPPLCFLDFSNGTSVAKEQEDEKEDKQQEDDKKTETKEEDKDEKVAVKFFFLEWFF
ncbi:stage II sporulation protein R [Aquibacillus sp. 3ASR75-11]|uniref:Stage II sporulation protein R n=1 Tax=Terrihalobacillus insolitus TaxID=2950438 RepID=A0A9X3WXD1_9BACI|nr:stage II sporulation protein R [Terrihalobacillus insolitus]MDC3425044.1 stage II sporulation protein R [Terrihalobacillus insolitus]